MTPSLALASIFAQPIMGPVPRQGDLPAALVVWSCATLMLALSVRGCSNSVASNSGFQKWLVKGAMD